VEALRRTTEVSMTTFNVRTAVDAAMDCVRKTNQYITERAPWLSDDAQARQVSVRTTVEAVYIFAHFLEPYIPAACKILLEKLHTPARTLGELRPTFDNLTPGTPVAVGSVLFDKLDVKASFPTPNATDAKPAETLTAAQLEAAVAEQAAKVRTLKEVSAGSGVVFVRCAS
jgi:methionyl-tRNA synthetase